jgi:hypothetical protein
MEMGGERAEVTEVGSERRRLNGTGQLRQGDGQKERSVGGTEQGGTGTCGGEEYGGTRLGGRKYKVGTMWTGQGSVGGPAE